MQSSEARNPRSIILISYLLFSFPFSYILILGSCYNLPPAKMLVLFFSIVYLLHSALAVFTGWAMHKMRPYAWHLFVFHCLLVIAEQFYVAYAHAENHIVEVPLVMINLSVIISFIWVKSELRVPYFNPKLNWWESDPRYKISVPAEMTCSDHRYKGEIMDISASGCFIKSKDPIKVDQTVIIRFSLFDRHFELNSKVVWRTESGVTHPKGIGLRFSDVNKSLQTDLKSTVKKLRTLSRQFQTKRAEEKALQIEQRVQALLSQRKP